MPQLFGETRDEMAMGCMKLVEEFANKMRSEVKPFYIVFFAKPDCNVNGIRQTVKAYFQKPAKMLGILVWYVNNPLGIFDFVPELSSPPDVPLNAKFLSSNSADSFGRVMQTGKDLNILVS